MGLREVFSFPHPVNEVAARTVAAGVVGLAALTLATRQRWLLVPLAYGFVARVLTGPTLSPLGQVATRVVTPRLAIEPRWVAGPPKRFAQGIGAAFSLSALALAFGFRRPTAAYALVGILGVFATLEAAFGFCLGCKVFAILMRLGIVPEEVCADCNNIWARAGRRGGVDSAGAAG